MKTSLIIALVIVILVFYFLYNKQNEGMNFSSKLIPPYLREQFVATDSSKLQKMTENCKTIESVSIDCGGDENKFQYAVDDFGAPGLEYKDWVMMQSVEPKAIKNHLEYVDERLSSTTQNITGKTYSPDMHDSYDPIPWSGLRRPQAVATCNPTEVPDVDTSLYSRKRAPIWDYVS